MVKAAAVAASLLLWSAPARPQEHSMSDIFAGFLAFSLLMQPQGCNEWPALAPHCNVAASADAWLLGPQHLYPLLLLQAPGPTLRIL